MNNLSHAFHLHINICGTLAQHVFHNGTADTHVPHSRTLAFWKRSVSKLTFHCSRKPLCDFPFNPRPSLFFRRRLSVARAKLTSHIHSFRRQHILNPFQHQRKSTTGPRWLQTTTISTSGSNKASWQLKHKSATIYVRECALFLAKMKARRRVICINRLARTARLKENDL